MAVTAEEVVWAYRMILGREPESEDAVRGHMGADNLKMLRAIMLGSAEFEASGAATLAAVGPAKRVPMTAPALMVEYTLSDEDEAMLWRRVRATWERLGAHAPYHSILTEDSYLPDAFADNEELFWESGEADAEFAMDVLARHGYAPAPDHLCIDYGCGVGRVTGPLASRFGRVQAYDISQPLLDIAQKRHGCSKITFVSVARSAGLFFPEHDLFYSGLALQHSPPPLIRRVLSRALAALRPGGFGLFQLPVYQLGYRFRLAEYLATMREGQMETHCLPQHILFRILAETECDVLEVREDFHAGRPDRIIANTIVVRKRD
jgi:SAM-dependent methyltransferase